MTFIPSQAQQNYFDWINTSRGNAVLEAVAGAGKTTTIVEGLRYMQGRVYLGAYNKKMADELKERIKNKPNVRAGTFHSVGFSALQFAFSKQHALVVDANKIRNIVDGMINIEGETNLKAYMGTICKMVSMAKNRGIGALSDLEDTESWQKMVDHYDLDDDLPDGCLTSKAIEYAKSVLHRSNADLEKIDFDDMVYMPILRNLRFFQYDWVLIDEAQDTNATRRELARRLLKPGYGRLVAVGDPCQPDGTMVTCRVRKGRFQLGETYQKKIEDLVVGETVVSYSIKGAGKTHREIKGITKTPYSGKLVNVKSYISGKSSRYTPNHQCIVKYPENAHVVYLMSRGNKFRVGVSTMGSGNGPGFVARMRQEDADAVWVLDVFENKKDALYAEAKISATFGIPDFMFTPATYGKNNVPGLQFDQSELNSIWSDVNNRERAEEVLAFYDKKIEYPYFVRGQKQVSMRRPHIAFACNILSGAKMQMEDLSWEFVSKWEQSYTGNVYSLTVSGEELYYADGILTHNCQAIFGFTGADNDALEQIVTEFKCKKLPLTVSYRCPKAVVKHARNWVSHIEPHADAPDGKVMEMPYDQFLPQIQVGDAILCRYNKFLVALCFKLIRAGKPAKIEGRSIGEGLIKLCDKWKCSSTEQLRQKLEKYMEREVERALKEKKEDRADRIIDQVETMFVLIDRGLEQQIRDVKALKDMIRGMFEDDTSNKRVVILSSIHRSKGLEWKKVYILGRAELMPSRMAKQPWNIQQEINLIYVAVTRAKETLIEVTGIQKILDNKKA